ncbi:unnamed protein product [Amoebophrya sp. A120]|nr:unnamed protein product [Amoebophrya sp. A120]|eukprot:GSA120T00004811001.1
MEDTAKVNEKMRLRIDLCRIESCLDLDAEEANWTKWKATMFGTPCQPMPNKATLEGTTNAQSSQKIATLKFYIARHIGEWTRMDVVMFCDGETQDLYEMSEAIFLSENHPGFQGSLRLKPWNGAASGEASVEIENLICVDELKVEAGFQGMNYDFLLLHEVIKQQVPTFFNLSGTVVSYMDADEAPERKSAYESMGFRRIAETDYWALHLHASTDIFTPRPAPKVKEFCPGLCGDGGEPPEVEIDYVADTEDEPETPSKQTPSPVASPAGRSVVSPEETMPLPDHLARLVPEGDPIARVRVPKTGIVYQRGQSICFAPRESSQEVINNLQMEKEYWKNRALRLEAAGVKATKILQEALQESREGEATESARKRQRLDN